MQRAKKGASLYDFFDMLALIVDYAMQDMKVKFIFPKSWNTAPPPDCLLTTGIEFSST